VLCGLGSRLRIGFPHVDGQPTLRIPVAVGLGTIALAHRPKRPRDVGQFIPQPAHASPLPGLPIPPICGTIAAACVRPRCHWPSRRSTALMNSREATLCITANLSSQCLTTANEATGLLPRARVVLRNRVRVSRQLIVAQSADDVLDRVVDPGVRDVIAMPHVG